MVVLFADEGRKLDADVILTLRLGFQVQDLLHAIENFIFLNRYILRTFDPTFSRETSSESQRESLKGLSPAVTVHAQSHRFIVFDPQKMFRSLWPYSNSPNCQHSLVDAFSS